MNLRPWALGALLTLLAACGSNDGVCGEIYDKSKKCWEEEAKAGKDQGDKDDLPSKAEFVAMCKAATKSRKQEVDLMAACIKEDSCEAIDECMDKAHEAEYAKKRVGELNEKIAAGNWSEAFDSCRYAADSIKKDKTLAEVCEKVFTDGIPKLTGDQAKDVLSACGYEKELAEASPAFAKACTTMLGADLEAKKQVALAARDAASEDYAPCYDLQSAAANVSEQAKKDAEALCAEITVATSAKHAIDEAKASIDGKKSDISFYCKSAAEDLTKLDPKSDWAKAKLEEVLKTCYLDLGKVVLEVEAPNLQFCPWSVSELREAFKTYNLAGKDPELDAALAKTDKACATTTP